MSDSVVGFDPRFPDGFLFLIRFRIPQRVSPLNSNMACGQHQDQVLPAEGIVSAYHFMNQYVSEP